MTDCVFCKIIAGEIPSKKLFEDEYCYAFYDIEPQAPVHFLVVTKEHIASANELTEENATVISHIFLTIQRIAKELKLEKGYRIVNNIGEDGGQSVKHIHFHILGGRSLAWPPG